MPITTAKARAFIDGVELTDVTEIAAGQTAVAFSIIDVEGSKAVLRNWFTIQAKGLPEKAGRHTVRVETVTGAVLEAECSCAFDADEAGNFAWRFYPVGGKFEKVVDKATDKA